MTAYGCSNQPTTVQVPANAAISNLQGSKTIQMKCSWCGHSFTVSSDRVGKTVRCPNCNRTLTEPHRSRSWFIGWFGRDRTPSSSPPPIASSNPTTGTSQAPSASHVSYGGFGDTGAHFSGGS
jgi:ribosomal protein S27E